MKIFIWLFIAICCLPLKMTADNRFYNEGTFDLRLYGSYSGTSSYYDMEGDVISTRPDYTRDDSLKYVFTFRTYTFGLFGEYYLSDHWSAYANVPIAHYTLEEVYQVDSNHKTNQRFNASLTKPVFYALGTRYELLSGKFSSSALLELRVPPGFHNGILNDSTYPFLNDGAFEVLAGLGFNYQMETSRIEADVIYNHRAEELEDRMLLHVEAGLSTVPNTEFLLFSNSAIPLTSIDKTVPFNIRNTPLQEFYTTLGVSFRIEFDKHFYSAIAYDIKVVGRNTWNAGTIFITIGNLF